VCCRAPLLAGIVVVLMIGLAAPAPTALVAAADPLTLSPADQAPDDGASRILFLVPALVTAVPAPGSRIVCTAPQAACPAVHRAVSVLARAPPHGSTIPGRLLRYIPV
jgi:hypothetical protein